MSFTKTRGRPTKPPSKHNADYDSLYEYLRAAPNPSEDDNKRDYAVKLGKVPLTYEPIIQYLLNDPTIHTPTIKFLTVNISKRGLAILEKKLASYPDDIFELYSRAVIKESDHSLKKRYVYPVDGLTCAMDDWNSWFYPGKAVKNFIFDHTKPLGFFEYHLAVYIFYAGLKDLIASEKYINEGIKEVIFNGNNLLHRRMKTIKDFIDINDIGELDMGL